MKTHRWMISTHKPCNVHVNEDGNVFAKVTPIEDALPTSIYCWDCERPLEQVWGEECLADFDMRLDNTYWEMIKNG